MNGLMHKLSNLLTCQAVRQHSKQCSIACMVNWEYLS